MSRHKPENQPESKAPDLETYMKDVDHVTADMRKFAHKLRRLRHNLLGPNHGPSLGRT